MLRGVLILDAPEMVDILDEWNRVDLESLLVFFFSSRRRHMRCLSDWSSDVCSSDLVSAEMTRCAAIAAPEERLTCYDALVCAGIVAAEERLACYDTLAKPKLPDVQTSPGDAEIGRASCRERV